MKKIKIVLASASDLKEDRKRFDRLLLKKTLTDKNNFKIQTQYKKAIQTKFILEIVQKI